tara:strand:- start:7008 stop:8033 length:1026 start_codon:yes stop_codon:yes gene_type:complete
MEARKFLPVLINAREEIQKRLAKAGTNIATKKELKLINKDLTEKLRSIYADYAEELVRDIRPIVKAEYEFQKTTLTTAIDQTVNIKAPTQAAAINKALTVPMAVGTKGAGQLLNNLLKQFPIRESERVVNRITMGFFQGETVAEISTSITGTKAANYRDGLLNISRAQAFTLAKTAVTQAQEQAKQELYKNNQDIVAGYEIIATLDSKTSQICRGYDGQIFLYKDGPGPMPPFHYNCRSTTAPVLDERFTVDTKSTRASVGATGGKQVDANKTYYTWLKDQPAEFQNDALGNTQGKIFRNAGLTPEEFRTASVNRFNQPLSIDEMARKDARIAEYLSKNDS